MKMLLFILSLLLTLGSVCIAQNAKLDSLIIAEENFVGDDLTHLKLIDKIHFSLMRIDPKLSIEYCNKALSLAEKMGIASYKASAISTIACIHIDAGEFDLALEELNQVKEIDQLNRDSIQLCYTLMNFGALYAAKSEFDSAIQYYLSGESILEKNKDDKLYLIYYNLGTIYFQLGEYQKTQMYLLKSLEWAEKNKHLSLMAECYSNLGAIYEEFGEVDKSIEYSLKALEIFKSEGEQTSVAVIKKKLAGEYFDLGQYEESVFLFCEAYAIADKFEAKRILIEILANLATRLNQMDDSLFYSLHQTGSFDCLNFKAEDQYGMAILCSNKSLSLIEETEDILFKGYCYVNIGRSNMKLKKFEKAISCLQIAIKYADSLSSPEDKLDALLALSETYEAMEIFDSAYKIYRQYIELHDSIDNQSIRDQLARKEAEYELSVKEKDLLHQKEMSDVAATSANTELQRQLLFARTSEQEILLKDRALEIRQKEKEMQHLAYLKKMAELDVVKLEKQDKDKQLSLTKQSFALQNLKLSKRELERNLLIVGVALSLFSIFLIFRNYRNQRKANLRQQELNALVSETNEELNVKNTELAATLDNLRITQAQLVETEKQKENEVIRRRISQDIHDDISSGLTRIAWLSELAKEKASQRLQEDATSALQKIIASSRETVDRLGEIIWAINPDRDNLEGFFAYLRTYVVKFFEDMPFKVTLDFPEKKPDLKFNPDLKRTLFLVVKEALHNVAKHSKASQVAVAFHCPDHRYSITITDDGKGFDMATTNLKGNGLKNMQKRMESVGGAIKIESSSQGTVVHLTGEVFG